MQYTPAQQSAIDYKDMHLFHSTWQTILKDANKSIYAADLLGSGKQGRAGLTS